MTKLVQVRVDEKVKNQANQVFIKLGIDMPTAIRIFLKKVSLTHSIPFTLEIPEEKHWNLSADKEEELLEALNEEEQSPVFEDIDEAIAYLNQAKV